MSFRRLIPKRGRKAFTLVEVLAALAFMGLVIPTVVSALMVGNRAAVVAERSLVAAQLGENRLAELMLGNAWTSAANRGDFGPGHANYRWEMTRRDWQSGAMTELSLKVYFKTQGREQVVELSTLVSESVTPASPPEPADSAAPATPQP